LTVVELKKLGGRLKLKFPVESIISLWIKVIIKIRKVEWSWIFLKVQILYIKNFKFVE
jgi:hypothetical protein